MNDPRAKRKRRIIQKGEHSVLQVFHSKFKKICLESIPLNERLKADNI